MSDEIQREIGWEESGATNEALDGLKQENELLKAEIEQVERERDDIRADLERERADRQVERSAWETRYNYACIDRNELIRERDDLRVQLQQVEQPGHEQAITNQPCTNGCAEPATRALYAECCRRAIKTYNEGKKFGRKQREREIVELIEENIKQIRSTDLKPQYQPVRGGLDYQQGRLAAFGYTRAQLKKFRNVREHLLDQLAALDLESEKTDGTGNSAPGGAEVE